MDKYVKVKNKKSKNENRYERFKENLISIKAYSIFIIIMLVLVVTAAWGFNQYNSKKRYQAFLSNEFNRSFYTLNDYTQNISILLNKVQIATAKNEQQFIFSQLWRQSFAAQDIVGQLPIDHAVMAKTSKYLKQVGDYSYSLEKKLVDGKSISKNDLNKLDKLSGYSDKLQNTLYSITNSLESGRMDFGSLAYDSKNWINRNNSAISAQSYTKDINKIFSKYPLLIYDGPFADHAYKKQTDRNEKLITKEKAKQEVKQFLGTGINQIQFIDTRKEIRTGSSAKPNAYVVKNPKSVKVITPTIDMYRMQVKNRNKKNNYIYVDITKKGGYIANIINPQNVNGEKLSYKQAATYARRFLNKVGYKNMEEAYFQKYQGSVVINYIYKDDKGILYYPDMIKVKVSLKDGNILGVDAISYLTNHRERKWDKASLTIQQAQTKIKTKFNIQGKSLVVIPDEAGNEILCYEFKGKYRGKYYIVYVNANTGKEESILQVIDTDRGILAM